MVKFFHYVCHFFEVDFNFFSDNHNWKDLWLKENQASKKKKNSLTGLHVFHLKHFFLIINIFKLQCGHYLQVTAKFHTNIQLPIYNNTTTNKC